MANWLTISDFVDEIQLSNSSIASVNTEFTSFLGRVETEFLRKVLGYTLYSSFIAGLATTPTIPAIWTNLKNGCSFVASDGNTYYFDGLKEALKYYSYFKQQNRLYVTNIQSSNVEKKSDISTVTYPMQKVVSAQNRCIEILEDMVIFIALNEDSYPNLVYECPFPQMANILGI